MLQAYLNVRDVFFFQKAIGARRIPNFIFALYSGFIDNKINNALVPSSDVESEWRVFCLV